MNETIIKLSDNLRELKKGLKKRNKISDKRFAMTTQNSTKRQLDKASGDLIECNKHIYRLKLSFARTFKDSYLDVDTGEQIINTSGFHEYKM